MSTPFDPGEYVKRIARRLVVEFDDASQAGTPGLRGSAREHPARRQLERLLPGVAAVGSGQVIDSFGGVSRQEDVVLYERPWCPVFSINETPEATYYPCEGVISVGEVKSRLGSAELEDAFEKIASAKRLTRYAVKSGSPLGLPETVAFRRYGSPLTAQGTLDEQFDQQTKQMDQIFGFVLCGEFGLKPDTMLQRATDLWKRYPRSEGPNMVLSLNNGFLQPHNAPGAKLLTSPLAADSIAYSDEVHKGIGALLRLIALYARSGRTVEANHFDRYCFSPAAVKTGTRILLRAPL